MPWFSQEDGETLGRALGYLPEIIRDDDPRPAITQINERYAHGGGWYPVKGWAQLMPLEPVANHEAFLTSLRIQYPGDPPLDPVAVMLLPQSNELVAVYQSAWVMVVDLDDRTYEVARLD